MAVPDMKGDMDAGSFPPTPMDRDRTDEAQFRTLYLAHAEGVYLYCLRRIGFNRAIAEDATADTFVVVWRRLSAVPPPPRDRAFIYAIARRQLSNHERGMRRLLRLRRRISVQRPEPPGATGEGTWVRQQRISSVLEELPPGQREALILVVLEGFSHADAARVLGCSENAIAVRLHRARNILRDRMAEGLIPAEPREPRPTNSGRGAGRWK